jgi:hypothetical protein
MTEEERRAELEEALQYIQSEEGKGDWNLLFAEMDRYDQLRWWYLGFVSLN